MKPVNEKASLGQFHKMITCLLSKYPEMEELLNKEGSQVLIKNDERLVKEFILFVNNGGMPNESHMICGDVQPDLFHPQDGYYLKKHTPQPDFPWNPKKISLVPLIKYRDHFASKKGIINGWLMHEYFSKHFSLCNGCIADYLFDFRYLIPESWKEYPTLFLNTIYGKKYGGTENGDAYVRFMGCDYENHWDRQIKYFPKMYLSDDIRFCGRSFKIENAMVACFK